MAITLIVKRAISVLLCCGKRLPNPPDDYIGRQKQVVKRPYTNVLRINGVTSQSRSRNKATLNANGRNSNVAA